MRNHFQVTSLLLVAALLGAGCEIDRSPRQLAFPRFDPAQPFTEPSPGRVDDGLGSEGAAPLRAEDDFEQSLMASSARPAEDEPAARAVSFQSVPLAGRLVGRIPQSFDEWSWAGDEEMTLIVHSTAGRPDALIYAEAFSDLADRWPTREADRFHRTVAPSLASGAVDLLLPEWPALVAALASETGLKPTEVRRALRLLLTRTLGRGIGFRESTGTFTGWKWVGRNGNGVELRLGRLSGEWGMQAALDEQVRRVLDALASRSVRFARLRDSVAAETRPPQSAASATMVLGNATPANADRGVHLAIVCGQAPRCPVAEDLAGFLGSLRLPGQSGEASASQGGKTMSDLDNVARRVSIRLKVGSLAVTAKNITEVAGALVDKSQENSRPNTGVNR